MNILAKYKAMKALKKAQNRKGFTLVEVLLVLAVATAIITIGLRIYSSVQSNTKLTQTVTEVGQVRSAIESLYQGQGTFTALAVTDLATTLPSSMVTGTGAGATLKNAFNGAITVGPDQIAAAGDSYFIGFANLDDTSCARLATTDFGHSLVAVGVSNSNAAPAALGGASAVGTAVALPITPGAATAACNGGTASPDSLTFQFR